MAAAVVAAWLVVGSASVEAKSFLVLGGMFRSHHISMVPIVEELCARGHDVTFVLPSQSESKDWFPQGISTAKLVHLGSDGLLNFEIPDLKMAPLWKKPIVLGRFLWGYREQMDNALFAQLEDFGMFMHTRKFDMVVSSMASIALNAFIRDRLGLPSVGFLSVAVSPQWIVPYSEELCRYPNMISATLMEDLRSSFVARVKNQMLCQFMRGYEVLSMHEMNAVFVKRGFKAIDGWKGFMNMAPIKVALGGAPFSLAFKLPAESNIHVLGTVERRTPQSIPAPLKEWLDKPGGPVVYVSMGTKYELSAETCQHFLKQADELTYDFGFRVLWSLRAAQQESLRHLLPAASGSGSLRIEEFTPQPEVLKHRSVKVFVSHCGWGGVTDTLAAGVPVLAFPSFSDQQQNAARLVDLGAALLLQPDFSDLVMSTRRVMAIASFEERAAAAGAALQRLGGVGRFADIAEAAAEGRRPEVEVEPATEIDPFFEVPQHVEAWVATVLWLALGLLLSGVALLPVWCCCRCCCGRRGQAPPAADAADAAKKRQ